MCRASTAAPSERLTLRIIELPAKEVYGGGIGSMPEQHLGTLAGGESRTYRFTVAMDDGGPPSSPYTDDNVYQAATASLGYRWTLTEVEDAPPPPPGPAPPRSSRA